MQQQQQAQSFAFQELTGQEVETIMNGLNELPSKLSRGVMNKLEQQIVKQLQPVPTANTKLPDGANDEK